MTAAAHPCAVATQPFGLLCGDPDTACQRASCACAHIRKGWVCARHRGAAKGQCRICAHLPGGRAHPCPVWLTDASGPTTQEQRAERIVIGAFLRAMDEFGIPPHQHGQCPPGCGCEALADQLDARAGQIAAAALSIRKAALS